MADRSKNNTNKKRKQTNKALVGRTGGSSGSSSRNAAPASRQRSTTAKTTRKKTSQKTSKKTAKKAPSGRNIINLSDFKNRRSSAPSGRTSSSRKSSGSGRSLRSVDLSVYSDSSYGNRRLNTDRSSQSAGSSRYSQSNRQTGYSQRPQSKQTKQQNKKKNVVHKKVKGIGYEGAAQVFMVIFLLLASLYIGGNILRYALRSAVSYDTVQIGSIDTPKSAEGLIIRSETVYQSDMDGSITYLVPDGDKVKTGDTICTVKLEEAVADAEASINDINDDIISSEKMKQEIDANNEEARKLNMEIKALADEASISFVAMDTLTLRDFTNNATVKQEMRNQAILSGSSSQRSAEKKKAETVIAENSKAYTALEGGIMCLETDGYESELIPDNMTNLTEKDIKKSSDSSHVSSGEVKAGENIFKIMTSNVWYIATYIDSDYVLEWEKGDRHIIYLTNPMGESIEMDVYVENIVPGSKKTFMVLRASKYMADFMSQRNITFEIDKVQTGYKISNSSIVENTLIKIPAEYISGGTVTKQNGVKVTVGDPVGDYAYFPVGYDTLVLHDIIANPNNSDDFYELNEVDTRQGVYVMNTGIAEFYTIDMTGSTSNSTHTILDPAKNANISIYDRVVVDPKNIEADDMLYK